MCKLSLSPHTQKVILSFSKFFSIKGAIKFATVLIISAISAGVVSAGSPIFDLDPWFKPAGHDLEKEETEVAVKVPYDHADFLSQDIPNTLNPGEAAQVTIRMKNTGTSTWTRQERYKFGSQNPQDNSLWTGATRIDLSPSESIAPGQVKEFTFTIIAPNEPGSHTFQWRMVKEGVHWFGDYSHSTNILVRSPKEGEIEKAPIDKAEFISQDVPDLLQPGQIVQVSITMENTGTSTWTRVAGYKLGSQNPQDNRRWTGGTRIYLDHHESITPGERVTFTFKITAPSEPGLYPFQWRMVHEDVSWFGRHSRNLMIRVKDPDDATFISQEVPEVLSPGQRARVTITMQNSGESTWTPGEGYKLGSQDPQDNKLWTGGTRIYLDSADAIAPGQRKTFTFEITAPSEPGLYHFQWRMVHEDVSWFGQNSRNISIRVKVPEGTPENSPTPLPTNTPVTHTPGQTTTPTPVTTKPPQATSTPLIPPTNTPENTPYSPTEIPPTDPPEVTPSPTSSPTPYINPTPTAVSILWEEDPFDNLPAGALHGMNGWWKIQASAQVITTDGGGKILMIDSNPNVTIAMDKSVPKQSDGRQHFEFDVMVTGATEASLAKIEMRTNANAGWDKKFQLYFGSSMRVNYSPSGAATNIVPSTQMGRWYHIRCDMDLGNGKMDVWVDGVKVASGIPMHPGPLRGLSISGWDRVGAVYLDNLVGRSD